MVKSSCCCNDKLKFKLSGEVHGTFPGNPEDGTGDLFGVTVAITRDEEVVVAATSASPPNSEGVQQNDAGALYFFSEEYKGWKKSQEPFTIPVRKNQVGSVILATKGKWLFSQALGTPLDVESPKDGKGAVLVFKSECCKWKLHQTIDNNFPGQFVFGLNLDYDGGDYMVVGGAAVTTAFVYKINKVTDQWEFFQQLDTPEPTFPGYVFPSITKNGHLFFNKPVPLEVTENGKLFAYRLVTHGDESEEWVYKQTLEGIDNPIDPTYGNGDFLGNFMDMYRNWAVVAASYDNQKGPYTGAVYFFHYEKPDSTSDKQWVLKQKVFSDDPNVLFGFGVAIDHDLALLGDIGRTINGNIYQGAGVVYKKRDGVWEPLENGLLIDPNGRPYDFLGGGGTDIKDQKIADGLIVLGTDTFSDYYLPEGFPGKRPYPPYDPPANDGRAVIYKIR